MTGLGVKWQMDLAVAQAIFVLGEMTDAAAVQSGLVCLVAHAMPPSSGTRRVPVEPARCCATV